MIIERKVSAISNITRKATIFLSNELRSTNIIESKLIKKSLRTKKKIVEERSRTLTALYKSSIGEKKRKRVSGTLGLVGGGLLGRRLLRGRTPKIPRISRSPLSRVGRVGKFSRIGPLAVLGTGLDFVGRKAEGQTNLQAGLGAGGGLAGALAGGKAGALIGTAIGGPIGTVVGGIGGSIVGGLAGGRLADLFSGADRRRKFEIQRTLLTTEKSLFSSALDDLDRVLDKFTIKIPDRDRFIEKEDDDRPPIIRKILPKPPTDIEGKNITQKSRARLIGEELAKYAAIAGTIFLLVPTDPSDIATTAPLSVKLTALVKSTRLFRLLSKTKFLTPGKEIPAVSKKGLEAQAEKILNSLGTFIKKESPKFKVTKGRTKIRGRKVLKNQQKVTFSDKVENTLIKPKPGEIEKTLKLIDKINKKMNKNINPRKKKFIQKNLFRKLDTNTENINPPNISEVQGEGSTDIALAPTNNIFLINQGDQQEQPPIIIQGNDTVVRRESGKNTFDNATKYAEITALMTV